MQVARPRRGVTGAPVGDAGLGVVVAGQPDRTAAGFPSVGLPGFATGLAGGGDGVRHPFDGAGLGVQGRDVTTNAVFAARGADHDLALGDQRRHGQVITIFPIVDGGLPHFLAGLGIERDHEAIGGGDVDIVAVKGGAAIGRMELEQFLRNLALVTPDQVTGLGVERDRLVLRRGNEHDAVIDHRRRLMALGDIGREGPGRRQVLDVAGVDLGQWAEAPAFVIAAVHEPVFRLWIVQPRFGDGRIIASRGDRGQQHRRSDQRSAEYPKVPPNNHFVLPFRLFATGQGLVRPRMNRSRPSYAFAFPLYRSGHQRLSARRPSRSAARRARPASPVRIRPAPRSSGRNAFRDRGK